MPEKSRDVSDIYRPNACDAELLANASSKSGFGTPAAIDVPSQTPSRETLKANRR
jgi:hypothetical protein